MAPKPTAKVLSVLKCKEAVISIEKIHVLDKFLLDMSYSGFGCEFVINELTMYIT